ncbi:hypothetical protein JK386_15795 [Nocardioides sp. zg-536]|uniref:Peptidase MA-like domain-containing protein n=1 Tax=Nocardioides faecalis TaxID=2803858 RepID=A0A939BZS5_9ACTN|nr:hypothetical protein [Nocardioides faecalis]MBM9461365.1 hypothetical protein [Nocardioides faecalis]QVI57634.1 hypothetical protein KG111_11105 [Nocardioides faecalis]
MIRRAGAALLALALLCGGCGGEEYVAPPPAKASSAVDATAATSTVTALQQALVAGDRAAAERLGADGPAQQLLAAVAGNVRELGLREVTLRYVTETGRTRGADGWDGLVALTWRMPGSATAAARLELPFSFADGGHAVSAIGGTSGRLPLWLAGPVTVRRVPGAVVVGEGAAADLASYARWARQAVVESRDVVEKDAVLVVEVPADTTALHRALGADAGEYAAIAAVTAPADGSRVPDAPVHVFLNRAVYDDLDPVAAQVVMTHEAVHALTGAVLAGGAPLWLVEGFADYVALRDLDLPLDRTAGQVIEEVRRDGLPDALPADTDFSPGASHLGGVYEAAWQVAVTLAERRGEAALVALYRAVLDGTKLAPALRSGFGWSEAELTTAWQERLATLAGVPEQAP